MNRKNILQNSLIIGGATILPPNSIFAASVTESTIDKLLDKDGNFIQPDLTNTENILDPNMDVETMHPQYTFHHQGAVKAANNDMKKLKMHLMQTILIR